MGGLVDPDQHCRSPVAVFRWKDYPKIVPVLFTAVLALASSDFWMTLSEVVLRRSDGLNAAAEAGLAGRSSPTDSVFVAYLMDHPIRRVSTAMIIRFPAERY